MSSYVDELQGAKKKPSQTPISDSELESKVANILARQFWSGMQEALKNGRASHMGWDTYLKSSYINWLDAARGVIYLCSQNKGK